MDFGEAALPGGAGADLRVRGGVEVSVAALFVVAEDDCGVGAGGDFVEEFLGGSEMVGASVEIAA